MQWEPTLAFRVQLTLDRARQILDIEEGKKEARKGLETPVQSRSVRMLEDALEEAGVAETCWNTAGKSFKIRQEGRLEVVVMW